jgi:hypothetical protein
MGDTTGANTNQSPISVPGTGDGNVSGVVQFNALRAHGGGALSLVGGSLYAVFASHGDNGPFHGWVVRWDVSSLATKGFQLSGVLNTSPNGGMGGISQDGSKLTFEPDGSAFYFVTDGGGAGTVANGNYYEALVKVTNDPSTTSTNPNVNGWGMRVSDYFIPYNVNGLSASDVDLGSGGVLLLPDSAGIPGHPHLLVTGGEEGKLYLVDRDNLGHFSPTADNVLNAVPNGTGITTPPVQIGGTLSTPAFFEGTIHAVSGFSSRAESFQIQPSGTLSVTSQAAAGSFGYLPGSPEVSSNGASNGIVWLIDRNLNALRAYDASSLATELWNSTQRAGLADTLGTATRLASPTIADGRVYVGTTNALVIYGLLK